MRFATVVLLACGGVLGCSRVPPSPAEQVERTRERADRLHERAIRLQGDSRRSEEAARLHRESARLRGPSDPRGFDCYAQAAQVLFAAGRADHARALLEEAAEFALSRADSMDAARFYAEAARIAAQAGQHERVLVLAGRLRSVARVPAMSARDSARLSDQVAALVAEAEEVLRSDARHERAESGR